MSKQDRRTPPNAAPDDTLPAPGPRLASPSADALLAPASIPRAPNADATLPAPAPPAPPGADATLPAANADATLPAANADATLPVPPPQGMEATLPPEGAALEGDELLTAEHPSRYEVRDQLGAGGMGVVHLGYDRHLGREVAIKEVRSTLVSSLSGSARSSAGLTTRTPAEVRFLAEARITGRLEHPGIVPVYELGKRGDGSVYYTMKRLRGRTLTDAIRAARDLRERLALLPCFLEICHAVAYAHSRGVIHRDLKPDNALLGDFGETVVLDWGMAKAHGERDVRRQALAEQIAQLKQASDTETVAGAPIGTPAYMPPEQAEGELEAIDERSDIYSLGAMLYQILTGRPPFTGKSAFEVIEKVRREEVPAPTTIEPACPPELAAIALRALRRRREERYADAQTLANDVLAFQTGGLVGAHTYSLWALLARWIRRHWRTIVVLLVVGTAGAGAWWYRGFAERRRTERAECARVGEVLRQVDEIIAQVERGTAQKQWFDTYTFKLISLREPEVERRLVAVLANVRPEVRRLAARSLGGMGSRAAVEALTRRLEPGVEPLKDVVVEVINALGIIGDWRAEAAVQAARWRYGQHSYIWRNTELAYRMIPLPPLADGGARLSPAEWHLRGRALENKGDPAGALAAYDRAITLDPRAWRSYNNRASLRKARGDFDGALADFNRAIAVAPRELAARHNRGLLRRDLGDFKGALDDMNQVLTTGKLGSTGLRGRATLRTAMGDFDGARADLEQALAREPDSPTTQLFLGDLWRDREDWPQALAAYDRALALSPSYVHAFINRAFVHQVTGKLQAALDDLDRALAIDGESASARRQRAHVRLLLGNVDGAKEDLDRSVAMRPAEAWRWAQRGVIFHAQRGQLPQAGADLAQALRRADARERLELRLCALGLALLRGDVATRDQLRRAIAQTTTPMRLDAQLVRLIRGEVTPEVVEREVHLPDWRCEVYLAAGVAAELRDKLNAAALAEYRKGARAARPNNLGCILCRLLAQRSRPAE